MLRDFLYKSYLNDGERIAFVIHRHIFMQVKDFLKIIFFGWFIPLFTWWLFPQITPFAVVWLLIGIIRFIYEFFDWYYDVWLVTDQSVIEIMWEGFFKKSSARIEYHTIQGIGYEVQGLLQTVFNYGSLSLEKFAGNSSVFLGAVNPKRKSEMLTQAQDEFVRHKNFRDQHALKDILTELVHRHVVENGMPKQPSE